MQHKPGYYPAILSMWVLKMPDETVVPPLKSIDPVKKVNFRMKCICSPMLALADWKFQHDLKRLALKHRLPTWGK